MTTLVQQQLARLRGRLIVSCQAPVTSPLHDPYVIARIALAAERCGAGGVRIDTPAHIAETRAICTVPVIGLHKQMHEGSQVYITPTCAAAAGVVEAGADIVAVDATARPRPCSRSISTDSGRSMTAMAGSRAMRRCAMSRAS